MDILKIVLLAIVAVAIILVVRQLNHDVSVALSIGAGVLILSLICDELYQVIYTFYNLSSEANVNSEAINCVIKVVGIGYLAEFANNLCVDTNNKNLGEKVLLASRVAILLCALPIVTQLFDVITGLLI